MGGSWGKTLLTSVSSSDLVISVWLATSAFKLATDLPFLGFSGSNNWRMLWLARFSPVFRVLWGWVFGGSGGCSDEQSSAIFGSVLSVVCAERRR